MSPMSVRPKLEHAEAEDERLVREMLGRVAIRRIGSTMDGVVQERPVEPPFDFHNAAFDEGRELPRGHLVVDEADEAR